MGVSFGRKLIFHDHPRTAGTSTQWGMARIGGKTFRRHQLVGGRANIRCCTVRNPFDLLISWYLIQVERNQFCGTLLEFITNYQNYNFTRGGRLFYFVEACNEIMRFENIQKDLTRVLAKAKLPNIKLQHRNKTPKRQNYKTYYDDNTRAAVKLRFSKDLEEFNYEF